MAKTLLVTAGSDTVSSGGTTNYRVANTSFVSPGSTEANRQIIYELPGTFSNMYAYLAANATTSPSTLKFRVNGANGNQSISIGTAATGVFEDASNTDTIVAADKVNYQVINGGGGTCNFKIVSSIFNANSNTVSVSNTNAWFPGTTSGGTEYAPLIGAVQVAGGAETELQYKVKSAGTFKKMTLHISANSRTVTDTYRTRLNTANGAQSISVTTGATGFFEDNSNTDSVVVDDLFNFSCVLGAQGSTFTTVDYCAISFETTDNSFLFGAISPISPAYVTSMSTGASRFIPVCGENSTESTTEANTQAKAGLNMTMSNLSVNVVVNTASSASSCFLRKNAGNTSLTVSITGSTTGTFVDNSNTVVLVPTDLINTRATNGGGGNLAIRAITMKATTAASPILRNRFVFQAVNRAGSY